MSMSISFGAALAYLFGFAAFASLSPYFFWETHALKLIAISLFVLTFFYIVKIKILEKKHYYLFVYFSILIALLQFSGNGVVLYLTSPIILLLAFFLLGNDLKFKSFHVFYGLFAISLVPGLFLFLLLLIGYDLSWFPVEPNNELKKDAGLYYRNYIVAVVLSSQIFPIGFSEIFRFSGVFDEPGRVGTVAALLLAADGFKLKSIRSKIVLMAGVLSFSLAFYILILVYALIKKPVYLAFFLFPFLVLGSHYYGDLKSNPLLERYVFDRFEKGLNDPGSVDNRASDCFKDKFSFFIENGNLVLGNGASAHANTMCDVSSYLSIIYNHGLLGLFLIVMLYIAIFISLNVRTRVLFSLMPFFLVFVMNIYQRPEVLSLWMILIFIGAVLHSKLLLKESRAVETV